MATDADLMVGGPGGGAAPQHGDPAPTDRPSAQPAGQTATVTLNGVSYTVPAGMAADLRREHDRMAGQFGSRLQTYERRLAALETEDEPADEVQPGVQPPSPKLLDATSDQYDPERYHRESLAYQHALVEQGLQVVEQRRLDDDQREKATAQQQANWNRQVQAFYTANNDLRGNEDIVDAVWRKNFNTLKDLSPEDGFTKLAELSKGRILEVAEAGKRANAPRMPRLETSGGARANASRETSEEILEPVRGGLSAAIKAKSRRFRTPFKQERAA